MDLCDDPEYHNYASSDTRLRGHVSVLCRAAGRAELPIGGKPCPLRVLPSPVAHGVPLPQLYATPLKVPIHEYRKRVRVPNFVWFDDLEWQQVPVPGVDLDPDADFEQVLAELLKLPELAHLAATACQRYFRIVRVTNAAFTGHWIRGKAPTFKAVSAHPLKRPDGGCSAQCSQPQVDLTRMASQGATIEDFQYHCDAIRLEEISADEAEARMVEVRHITQSGMQHSIPFFIPLIDGEPISGLRQRLQEMIKADADEFEEWRIFGRQYDTGEIVQIENRFDEVQELAACDIIARDVFLMLIHEPAHQPQPKRIRLERALKIHN